MNTGEAGQAEIARYESYIEADPENTLLWISLGDLYHRAGRHDEALASFEKCLLLDENNQIARGRLANVLITQHRFGEAERVLRQVIARSGEDPALLHNLGLTLFYQSKFDDANETFASARDAGLRLPRNLAYMVYSLHKQYETEAALDLAETWLKESPGPETEGYVSMLEMDHGDMDAARARADAVLAKAPDNPDANVVLGTWHVEQQQMDEALAYFQKVVRAEPDSPRGWQGQGLVYMYRRDFPRAIESVEKALQTMPDYATNHLIIGWAKLCNEDAVGSEKAFRQAVEANRNFAEAHGGLATALVFQKRIDEARDEIKKARGLDPKGFGATFAHSIILRLQGKSDMSTKLLSKMLEQQPMERSKPLIEHIQQYLQSQGPASTYTAPPQTDDKP